MNHLEREIRWLEEHAQDIQNRYPNAKRLSEYLELLSHLAEQRKAELLEIKRFIAGIRDPTAREIAAYRLFEGMTYKEIAALVQYCPHHVQRIWKPYREQYYGKESTEKRCRR